MNGRRVELFGVTFDALDFAGTLRRLVDLARSEKPSYVITANVDHIVRLQRRPELRRLYLEADMVVADGMPLVWASRLLRAPLPERVAGSDLFPALCAEAAERSLSIFLLGGSPGVAEKAARVLQKRHPALLVSGTCCPPFGFENDSEECAKIVDAIRMAKPDILFVGLGSPKQERWIAANREACGARLSIGVGISFSFVSGDIPRAPRWMQRRCLEWLHRLGCEPERLWKRYLVEDAPFLLLVLRAHWKHRRMPRTESRSPNRRPLSMVGGGARE